MANGVAPRAGAWIETISSDNALIVNPVAPRAGAWIETTAVQCIAPYDLVAPRAGAWIETCLFTKIKKRRFVAPRAGAWIETRSLLFTCFLFQSRPARARGLKRIISSRDGAILRRAPRGRVD